MPLTLEWGVEFFARAVDHDQRAWFAGTRVGRSEDQFLDLTSADDLILPNGVDVIADIEPTRFACHVKFKFAARSVVQRLPRRRTFFLGDSFCYAAHGRQGITFTLSKHAKRRPSNAGWVSTLHQTAVYYSIY